MNLQIDQKYENLFSGYKNESPYRRNIVANINKTNYEDLRKICGKIEYGLSDYDVIRLAEAYKTANQKLKDKIEYILTDINFHSECSELYYGHADKLIEEKKIDILKSLKNEVVNIFEKYLNQNRNSFEINANFDLIKEYSLKELDYLQDQGVVEQTDKINHTYKLTQPYIDSYLEKKWNELKDIPFIEVDKEQILDGEYWDFAKGVTSNEDIWHYFDQNYSKGVYYLLYEYENSQSSEKTEGEER